jgi:hypothetical protein
MHSIIRPPSVAASPPPIGLVPDILKPREWPCDGRGFRQSPGSHCASCAVTSALQPECSVSFSLERKRPLARMPFSRILRALLVQMNGLALVS